MLPDLQGTEICKILKQGAETRTIPVIMLTAKGEEIDRVLGFELGVEDYVVKPFSVRELLLRIQVVLRASPGPGGPDRAPLRRLRIDPEAHRAWVEGEEVHLTSTEFRLLITLYERRNRVQTPHHPPGGRLGHGRRRRRPAPWTPTSSGSGRNSGQAESYIETVRGAGYRFLGTPPEAKP